jgi:cell division septation protein DedD
MTRRFLVPVFLLVCLVAVLGLALRAGAAPAQAVPVAASPASVPCDFTPLSFNLNGTGPLPATRPFTPTVGDTLVQFAPAPPITATESSQGFVLVNESYTGTVSGGSTGTFALSNLNGLGLTGTGGIGLPRGIMVNEVVIRDPSGTITAVLGVNFISVSPQSLLNRTIGGYIHSTSTSGAYAPYKFQGLINGQITPQTGGTGLLTANVTGRLYAGGSTLTGNVAAFEQQPVTHTVTFSPLDILAQFTAPDLVAGVPDGHIDSRNIYTGTLTGGVNGAFLLDTSAALVDLPTFIDKGWDVGNFNFVSTTGDAFTGPWLLDHQGGLFSGYVFQTVGTGVYSDSVLIARVWGYFSASSLFGWVNGSLCEDTQLVTPTPAPSTPTSITSPSNTPTPVPTAPATNTPQLTATVTATASTPSPTPTCYPNWSVVPSPNQSTDGNHLYDVAAMSANDVWAVGVYGESNTSRTLVTHWDGTQWSVIPSPNAGAYHSYLSAVSPVSATDVWAIGYYLLPNYEMRTLVIHWDGTQWRVVPSPNISPGNNFLLAVSAVSADDVWVVGEYSQSYPVSRILVMHWDGASWSMVPVPDVGSQSSYLSGVSTVSANDVWAVGSYLGSDSMRHTLVMHWNGASWSVIPSPNAGSGFSWLNSVSAVSTDDVWAVGAYDTGGYLRHALMLHWDGASWSVVPGPDLGLRNVALVAVSIVSSHAAWAVGSWNHGIDDPDRTLILRWDGIEWSAASSPNMSTDYNNLLGVSAVSANDVWAVGSYHLSEPGGGPGRTLVEHYTCSPTCPYQFRDVPPDNTFYPFVRCLACKGIIQGYPCGAPEEPCNTYADPYFRPNNHLTRGQLAKIESESAAFDEEVPPSQQTFADVPYGSTFWLWVERLSNREVMAGYPCGGPGEPCDVDNRPYFRPNSGATRGQLTKIVSNAAGFNDTIPPTQYTFADVMPSHTFWLYIERLLLNRPNAMGGYACGGVGEPCDAQNRPYFRPNNPLTRGQTSKITSNTFFPGCNPPKS